MRDERICQVCGTHYSYCPSCRRYADRPRWMFNFHDENCMKIWAVINDYKAGAKTAERAKRELEKLDLSKKDKFNPAYQGFIKEIYAKAAPAETPKVQPHKDKDK